MEGDKYPDGVIVLRFYVHCHGCGNQVLKCLRGFDGVEGVDIDAKNQRVIVKGEKADPIKVAKRLRKKTGKNVELLHPQPLQPEKDSWKEVETPEVKEVVLKINMHCEGCAKEAKRCILDVEGVQTVDVEMKKNLVRVKGSMDPEKLVEVMSKRHAEIVREKENENENENENGGDEMRECECHSYCSDSRRVCAPQFFSDENPNACVVM